ncbi:Hypothetical protein FKW44_023286 [Caligus rogercresseyi]|uniref:Uncharacterized protein n=1 Tax=Caligus rogercresseyi TaxID=217165 RepID=A0A7T8JV03_CALRO|nr:Hypothetical protein FKW44_023286 [Caligus rogercresseyi]
MGEDFTADFNTSLARLQGFGLGKSSRRTYSLSTLGGRKEFSRGSVDDAANAGFFKA